MSLLNRSPTLRLLSRYSKRKNMPECHYKPPPYSGRAYPQAVGLRKSHMPNFQTCYYKQPLLMTHGYRQYLFDHKGDRYIDLCAGISTVNCGHSHPRITSVIVDQAPKLMHLSPIYIQQYQGQYCRMLGEQLGPGFDNVFLVNSGAEANDFAIMLARLYTQTSKFLSLRNGYHGLVGSSQAVTNVGTWNEPVVRGVDHEKLSYPSMYRGVFSTVDDYIREAEEVIGSCTSGSVAGFIAEPIMGVGGLQPLPMGYLKRMYELVRKHGGLCICDEVQTGFGRIGKDYWGFKAHGVQPDIVTMAKGIGNGFPMAAVATRKEIMDTIKKVHFNTFGGGLIQCRVGMQVLKIINDEKLHENADKVGKHFKRRLEKISEDSRVLGDVRGQGLMLGVELVKDKKTKEPAIEISAEVNEVLKECGVLVSKGGNFGTVFRMVPPLCMSMEDVDYVADAWEDALKKYN